MSTTPAPNATHGSKRFENIHANATAATDNQRPASMCAVNGTFPENNGAASATTTVLSTDVLALCASPALNVQP